MLQRVLGLLESNYRGIKPDDIAVAEGLEILECPHMPTRIEDVYVLETIILPSGLGLIDRQWRIGHCLGHYFLHAGNQLWLAHKRILFHPQQEYQANAVASYMLVNYLKPGLLRDWVRFIGLGGTEPLHQQVLNFIQAHGFIEV